MTSQIPDWQQQAQAHFSQGNYSVAASLYEQETGKSFLLAQILHHSQLAVKTASIRAKPACAGCPQTISKHTRQTLSV